jgi:hypothetical protein
MKDTRPASLPYRGVFGTDRPSDLATLPLPPERMPSRQGLRALKAWRYVGVFGPEIMLCAGTVRVGPAQQTFWAVWDGHRLLERTILARSRAVVLEPGRLQISDREFQADLRFDESAGIEAICPNGASYAWTRKQGGVQSLGRVMIDGQPQQLDAHAVIDDTAGYYPWHTSWRWSAGVGLAVDGSAVAWNLVAGVNDPPANSERTVWVDGEAFEAPPCRFASDLSGVDRLRFHAEAVRERRDNLLLVRSRYRQPFGRFSGELPGGVQLAEGYGVMEEHDARW